MAAPRSGGFVLKKGGFEWEVDKGDKPFAFSETVFPNFTDFEAGNLDGSDAEKIKVKTKKIWRGKQLLFEIWKRRNQWRNPICRKPIKKWQPWLFQNLQKNQP